MSSVGRNKLAQFRHGASPHQNANECLPKLRRLVPTSRLQPAACSLEPPASSLQPHVPTDGDLDFNDCCVCAGLMDAIVRVYRPCW